jgi:RND family efflux transporter MFP subunit
MGKTGDSAMSDRRKVETKILPARGARRCRLAALAASAALAIVFLAIGCGNDAGHASAATDPALPAAVVRVSRGDIAEEFSTAAVFRPYQEISIYAKVPGYVRKINVDIGDRVRKGELLATLEVPELVANVERARASVARSQEELLSAQSNLESEKSTYSVAHVGYTRLAEVSKERPGLVAQQEVDDAQGKDLQAQAGMNAGKSAVAAAEQQLIADKAELSKEASMEDYSRITAPFDGVITQRFADTGSMVAAGTASEKQVLPVVQLAENTLLRLDIPVPESVVPGIREGTPVAVKVASLNKTFDGKVVRFTRQLDLSTRTMMTEIDVPNPKLELVPGMYGTAMLGLQSAKNVLVLPAEAVVQGDAAPYVLAVDANGQVEKKKVTLGIEGANKVEITGSLNEGDTVIAAGQSEYHAGEKVSPRAAVLPPAPSAQGGNQ